MEIVNTKGLNIIPIIDTVILPNTQTKLSVDENLGFALQREITTGKGLTIALTVKEGIKKKDIKEDSFYTLGTLLRIKKVEKASKGYLIFAEGLDRIKINEISFVGSNTYGTYEVIAEVDDLSEESREKMLDFIKASVNDIVSHFKGNEEYIKIIQKQKNVNSLIGHLLPFINTKLEHKYELIKIDSVKERGLKFIDILAKQKEVIELQVEMAKRFTKKTNKNYRENVLREQLKAIKEELGEQGDEPGTAKYYQKLLEEITLPENVARAVNREIYKIENSNNNSSEANVSRNYLDLIFDLPWTSKVNDIDIVEARNVLDKYHYGMKNVKDRIIEHLAVMKIQNEKQGSILLLVGPPGTGKTSLGKSIAQALGREYVRISLGGVRDESEIRGHRRTYIGALPGRIIQGMKKAGTTNPVFVLDEVDKLNASHNGDPNSALLEVLDPKQNDSFADHYLEVPYDLSNVFFVATANSLNTIPRPLLDRLEVIEISSYTNLEKEIIAKNYLVKESLKEHGLEENRIEFKDEAIESIINEYTREAGVRGLKKQIDSITRKVVEKIVKGEVKDNYIIEKDMIHDLLGNIKARYQGAKKQALPGVVTGLAWTPVGGDILFIEGTFMPGSGNLMLTGQLGDVMRESAKIALSLVKSRLADKNKVVSFTKNDIHIHVPSGATPKDGPSAGITLLTALASLVTGKKVNTKLAMTGEITLSGQVMPVGGIKEKMIAAHRAGIKKVILPYENKQNVDDVPEDVKENMEFIYVKNIDEVLSIALGISIKSPEEMFGDENIEHRIGF